MTSIFLNLVFHALVKSIKKRMAVRSFCTFFYATLIDVAPVRSFMNLKVN